MWGCTAYVHVQRDQRSSLGPHMQKCVFIGYPAGYKGWKCWDMVSKRTIITERADFDERYFPARKDAHPVPTATPESVPAPGGRVNDVELDTDSTPTHSVDPIAPAPCTGSSSTSSASSSSSTPAQLSPPVPSVLTQPVRRS